VRGSDHLPVPGAGRDAARRPVLGPARDIVRRGARGEPVRRPCWPGVHAPAVVRGTRPGPMIPIQRTGRALSGATRDPSRPGGRHVPARRRDRAHPMDVVCRARPVTAAPTTDPGRPSAGPGGHGRRSYRPVTWPRSPPCSGSRPRSCRRYRPGDDRRCGLLPVTDDRDGSQIGAGVS